MYMYHMVNLCASKCISKINYVCVSVGNSLAIVKQLVTPWVSKS